jgi:hypothetical protein
MLGAAIAGFIGPRLQLHRHGPLRAARRRAGRGQAPGPAAPQLPGLQHAARLRPDRLGVSSIGRMGATYSQNAKTLPEYYDALSQGQFPDRARPGADPRRPRAPRGHHGADVPGAGGVRVDLAGAPGQDARTTSRRDRHLQADGRGGFGRDRRRRDPGHRQGWFFVRGVAMTFDKHLQADKTRERFSRIISSRMEFALLLSALALGWRVPHCAAMCAAPCAGHRARRQRPGRLDLSWCTGAVVCRWPAPWRLAASARWPRWRNGARCSGRCGRCCTRRPSCWACGCSGRAGSRPGWNRLGRGSARAAGPAAGWQRIRGPVKAGRRLVWAAWPCGLLQSALVLAALANSPAGGALVMTGFALVSATGLMAGPGCGRGSAAARSRSGPRRWVVRLSGHDLAGVAGWRWAMASGTRSRPGVSAERCPGSIGAGLARQWQRRRPAWTGAWRLRMHSITFLEFL